MDYKTVRNQISYWEAQEKRVKGNIKTENELLKSIQATLKSLRILLPKEDPVTSTTFVENRVLSEGLDEGTQ